MTSSAPKRREIIPQAVLKKLVRDHLLDVIYDAGGRTEAERAGRNLEGTLEFLHEAYAREAVLDAEVDKRISDSGS